LISPTLCPAHIGKYSPVCLVAAPV
jgi:hypothetical protein